MMLVLIFYNLRTERDMIVSNENLKGKINPIAKDLKQNSKINSNIGKGEVK